MSVTKVFVGSLPSGTKPEELRHIFESFGIVVECDVMNRCGFVHMQNPEMADNAISALNGMDFKGQNIVVEAGRPKDARKSRGRSMYDGDSRHGMQSSPMSRSRSPRRMDGFHGTGGYSGGGRGRGIMSSRGGSSMGGGDNFPRTNSMGPMRGNNYKQERSAPYQRGGGNPRFRDSGSYFDGPPRDGRFNDNPRGNFNNDTSGSYGGSGLNQSSNWERSNESRGNYSKGFSGNFNNDGGFSGNRDTGGQDRRGFALPAGGNQDRPHFSGSGRGGFGGNDRSIVFGQRNNERNLNGSNGGDRGGSRGGFSSRSNFSMGSTGGGGGRSGPPMQGGSEFKRVNNVGASNYLNEFPPLGSSSRGMNRNAPRQNMMSNRRY